MLDVPQVVLRLGVAALIGALVGLERERRQRAAGVRTMALVTMGAALFSLISIYPYADLLAAQRAGIEPSRIIAQIVTGIGFLGAGTIWLRKDLVRGLTTAAALWVMAAVGIACGLGVWIPIVTAIGVLLIVLVALRPIEQWIFPTHGTRFVQLRVTPASLVGETIVKTYAICERSDIKITALTIGPSKKAEGQIIKVGCRVSKAAMVTQALVELRQLPGVQSVHADLRGTGAPSHV